MSDNSDAARAALDQAVRDYTAATNPNLITTGWVMAIAGLRSDRPDGYDTYVTEAAPGMPWHARLGLWIYGEDRIRDTEDVDDE